MESFEVTLLSKARVGLAGEFINIIENTTEADPAGLLLLWLQMTGMMIGENVQLKIGSLEHRPNLFVFIVGNSSIGRKGTAYTVCRKFFMMVDPEFFKNCVRSGLSTQEGIIKELSTRGRSNNTFLGVQTEAASVFKDFDRQGNKLSEGIRDAYDGAPLGNMSVSNKAYIENHFIGLIFLITDAELKMCLNSNEILNGFANRFIWLWVSMSKQLPIPPEPDVVRLKELADKMRAIFFKLKDGKTILLGDSAKSLWCEIYGDLNNRPDERNLAFKTRATNHILRLSLIYAVLDESETVEKEHLEAAIEILRLSEAHVDKIFVKEGSQNLNFKILSGLSNLNRWVTQTEINEGILKKNFKSSEIKEALAYLQSRELVENKKLIPAVGKPTTLWKLTEKGNEEHYG